jgi:hypothetical protein
LSEEIRLLTEQIERLTDALDGNPGSGLAPAIANQIAWLKQQLSETEQRRVARMLKLEVKGETIFMTYDPRQPETTSNVKPKPDLPNPNPNPGDPAAPYGRDPQGKPKPRP